jgi:superfamily II DNA or RNA helicase
MKDPKRILTDAEKLQVLISYSYRCQGDGCEFPVLTENSKYEFHHVKPHSEGGTTVPMNHVPLCVSCHRKAHMKDVALQFGTPWTELREWQREALERYIADYDDLHTWVLEAAPGAGKSLFAASTANYVLNNSPIEHVVCIAPWVPIIRSLKANFGCYDLSVSEKFHYDKSRGVLQQTPAADVTIETYQGFCGQLTVDLIKKWKDSKGWSFFLILDEVHHTNTESGKWGTFLDPIAKLADKVLVMSGTYFRSDSKPIAFLEYVGDRPKRNYEIDYKECVAKRYTRQVSFRYHNPTLDIHSHKNQKSRRYKLASVPKSSPKMMAVARKEVLDPKGVHVEAMILDAWRELQTMRKKWHDAACLVVCRGGASDGDGDEERNVHLVAQKISKLTSADVVTVTSDDRASRGAIDAFVGGSEAFLCAIRMVSEGVDIPRVRMVLFLSYTESEMLFRQIVGRSVRWIKHKEDDTAALVIMPKFALMAEFAERFEDEAKQGIKEMPVRIPEPSDRGFGGTCQKCFSDPCKCFVVIDSEVAADGGQIATNYVNEEFIQLAMCVRDMSRAHQHANPVQLGEALRCAAEAKGALPTVSLADKRDQAWQGVARQMNAIARHAYGGDYAAAWFKEVHQKHHTDAAEIKATWRVDQIHELRDRLRLRLEEVLNA